MAQTKITIKLEGMEALQRQIVAAPEVVHVKSGVAVQRTTYAVANRMQVRVPVVTGTLKRSITPRYTGLNSHVIIQPEAWYWRFVEYGGIHNISKPFARPSAEEESNIFVQRMRAVGTDLERDWSTSRFV